MICKDGQIDVVENGFLILYQFECSTCEWNDSFWLKIGTNTRTAIRYSKVEEVVVNQFSIGTKY